MKNKSKTLHALIHGLAFLGAAHISFLTSPVIGVLLLLVVVDSLTKK